MLRIPALGLVLVIALAAACGSAQATPTPSLTPLTVGLGYIPSVQFAQFYRAQQQGYYRDAGLEVTFQNEIDPNLITLIGQGAIDIGMADGTSVIPAAGQGIPIRYAATIYAQFPSIVMATAEAGIASAADLRDRSIGIPGRYGSSWIMLQALLASAGMTPDDVEIREYPDFGQAAALQVGQIDAATGFRNNEPVVLELQGVDVNVLGIDDVTPLPGPGLTASPATLEAKGDAVRAFVAATLRAMEEITADPSVGLEDSIAVVPELASDRDTQLAILEATVEMWHSPYTEANGLGAIDPTAWSELLEFMRDLPDSNIPAELSVQELVTQEVLP